MILTTISTAAGFLSLLVTDVQPIRQLGLFVAIGIVFAGIISFFSLPALISRLTISSSHHKALIGPRVTAGLKRLVKTRTPAVVLTGGIVVFAAHLAYRSSTSTPISSSSSRTTTRFGRPSSRPRSSLAAPLRLPASSSTTPCPDRNSWPRSRHCLG